MNEEFYREAVDYVRLWSSPAIAVLSTDSAEAPCLRNSLTFCQLLLPFGRLEEDVIVRDPFGQSHNVTQFQLDFRDLRHNGFLAPSVLQLALTNILRSRDLFTEADIQNLTRKPSGTLAHASPWLVKYRRHMLQLLEQSEHEFLRCYMACIFVVSTLDSDPMEQLNRLEQYQHTLQHVGPEAAESFAIRRSRYASCPRWFSPNIFKYHVLIHDAVEGDDTRAEDVYQKMKTTYGAHACHLLRINVPSSAVPSAAENSAVDFNQYWHFLYQDTVQNFDSLKFEVNVKAPSESPVKSEDTVESAEVVGEPLQPAELSVPVKLGSSFHGECIPHPLSDTCLSQLPDRELTQASSDDCGDKLSFHLTSADIEELKKFVREFCLRGLIPYVERQLRLLNEQVSSRKGIGKSLFSATRKWFSGSSTPNLQTLTNLNNPAIQDKVTQTVQEITFAPESWEMQMRRLADLAFMFQLYEFAFQLYHTLRKEFSTQQAWLYYAGACEAASLCIFLLGAAAFRPYPSHYMEGAVATYANTSRRPWLAARAGFFSSSALCAQGAWGDAADQLIKMTSPDDLKSSLFLEEAARCFYNCGMVRKAALHFVLAGHRFNKAGLRHYTVYCYKTASAVYEGRGWRLAEDHIYSTLGHQYQALQIPAFSSSCFERLLKDGSLQSPYQQTVFFREYVNSLYMSKQSSGAGEGSFPLNIPWISSQDTEVFFGRQNAERCCFTVADESSWKGMERACSTHCASIVYRMSSETDNSASVLVPIGQRIEVIVIVNNFLDIPVLMVSVQLMYSFEPNTSEDTDFQFGAVDAEVIDEILLPPRTSGMELILTATCRRCGRLNLTGIAYGLVGVSFSVSEFDGVSQTYFDKSMVVYGYQLFNVRGKRLNTKKEERMTVVYGPDKRLEPTIVDPCPSLRIHWDYNVAEVLEDQLFCVPFTLENVGTLPIHNITACAAPSTDVHFVADDSTPQPTASVVRGLDTDTDGCQQTYVTFSLLAPDETLPPAHVLYRVCWIRASGNFEDEEHAAGDNVVQSLVKLVFYWHSKLSLQPSSPVCVRCRTFRLIYRYVCRKVFKLTCYQQRLSDHCQTDSGAHSFLLVDLSLTNTSDLLGLVDCAIKLLGIIINSADGYQLRSMISAQKDYVVQPGQSVNVCFDVCCNSGDQLAVSFLPLSSVFSAEQLGSKIFCSPWYPFLILGASSSIFLVWSVTWPSSTPKTVIGQSVIAVSVADEPQTSMPPSDFKHFVKYDIVYPPTVSHDFRKSRLCAVPVIVRLFNCSSSVDYTVSINGCNSLIDDPTASKASPWLWCGPTARQMLIRHGERDEMQLFLAVFTPCVLDLSSKLKITVTVSGGSKSSNVSLRSHFITIRPV